VSSLVCCLFNNAVNPCHSTDDYSTVSHFVLRMVHVGVVDKVELERDFLRVLRLSPVSIIPQLYNVGLSTLVYHLTDGQRARQRPKLNRDIISPHRNNNEMTVLVTAYTDRIINLKSYGTTRSWPNLRYHQGICLKGMIKTTEILSHDSRSLGRYVRPVSSEHDEVFLTTQAAHSV
jgi:hypothetical protein